MTRKEAIKEMIRAYDVLDFTSHMDNRRKEAFNMAKAALEQESILDKIRAEILEEKECAYADFERYKVEYLGQDSEDVLDSLPQDDFRYGMERCIDIIDKYKAKREIRDGK